MVALTAPVAFVLVAIEPVLARVARTYTIQYMVVRLWSNMLNCEYDTDDTQRHHKTDQSPHGAALAALVCAEHEIW